MADLLQHLQLDFSVAFTLQNLGLALLGKKPGEHVKVKTGGADHDYTVIGISRYVESQPAAGS